MRSAVSQRSGWCAEFLTCGARFRAQMHHVAGSPLLLCDTCPRSVHLACLDLDYGQLPPGNWSCPKCAEKGTKAANQIRRSANKDRRACMHHPAPLPSLAHQLIQTHIMLRARLSGLLPQDVSQPSMYTHA